MTRAQSHQVGDDGHGQVLGQFGGDVEPAPANQFGDDTSGLGLDSRSELPHPVRAQRLAEHRP